MEEQERKRETRPPGLRAWLARGGKPPFTLLRWMTRARKRGQVHAGLMPGCAPVIDRLGDVYFVCEEGEVAPLLAAGGVGGFRRLTVAKIRPLRVFPLTPDGGEQGDAAAVLAQRAAYWRARQRCAALNGHFKVEPHGRAWLSERRRRDNAIKHAAAMLVLVWHARGEWHDGKRGRPRHWRTPEEKVAYRRKSQQRRWAKWKQSRKGLRYFNRPCYRRSERKRLRLKNLREKKARRIARRLLRLQARERRRNLVRDGRNREIRNDGARENVGC